MTKPLVVFTHGGGRLGNQLINFAHLIAWVEECQNEVDLINMAFWNYADLFEGTRLNPVCAYPDIKDSKYLWYQANLLTRVLNRYANGRGVKSFRKMLEYIYKPRVIEFDSHNPVLLGNREFNEKIQSAEATFLSGWGWRNWEMFQNHRQKIRNILTPTARYYQIAVPFVELLRSKYDMLVGVSIRQGDYRRWAEGRYFFETEAYINWMREVNKLFYPKRIGYVIASDENQQDELFQDLNCQKATGTKPKDGHFIEDLVELSLCDLIISPPSTFSGWAAFIGDTPLLPLYEQDQLLSTDMIIQDNIVGFIKHLHFSKAVN